MPQKRERDGSIRTADDVDSSSKLIIHTDYHLFVVDIEDKDPVLLHAIDFVANKLPLNMGVMKLNKEFFMFGGEGCVDKYDPVTFPYHRIKYDVNFGEPPFEGAVKEVYKLDPKKGSLEFTTEVAKPNGPKFNPTVAEVNGKIFVLQGNSYYRKVTPHSKCEIYNPTDNTWKWFPDVSLGRPDVSPYLEDIDEDFDFGFPGYFFVGGRMYFKLYNVFYCFNCDTEEWENISAENPLHYLRMSVVPVPLVGCSFDENIFLLRCEEFAPARVVAYFIDNDSGILLYYQWLSELTVGFVGQCNMGMSLIHRNSGDGRMCLVLHEPKNNNSGGGYMNTFKIRHFKLKVTNRPFSPADTDGSPIFPKSRKFLEVEIMDNDQCYIVPENVERYGFFAIQNACFL